MKYHLKLAVSLVLSMLIFCGLFFLLSLRGKDLGKDSAKPQKELNSESLKYQDSLREPASHEIDKERKKQTFERPAQRKPEKPIEEELLEFGEDPGAVFYVSRIREALREGNAVFARELFRQMKELHSNSLLVDEANLLFSPEWGKP